MSKDRRLEHLRNFSFMLGSSVMWLRVPSCSAVRSSWCILLKRRCMLFRPSRWRMSGLSCSSLTSSYSGLLVSSMSSLSGVSMFCSESLSETSSKWRGSSWVEMLIAGACDVSLAGVCGFSGQALPPSGPWWGLLPRVGDGVDGLRGRSLM